MKKGHHLALPHRGPCSKAAFPKGRPKFERLLWIVIAGRVVSAHGSDLGVEVDMLQTDEDLKAYCYRHAEECARRAASQSDARHRQVYLELEKRWLSLSSEFACTEQVEGRDDDHSDQKREN